MPGLWRSPGGGNGNSLQYCCLENSIDRGTWRAAVRGITDWAQANKTLLFSFPESPGVHSQGSLQRLMAWWPEFPMFMQMAWDILCLLKWQATVFKYNIWWKTKLGKERYIQDPTCACVLSSFNQVQLFATPWTVAHQAPLSLGFSRQEYWGGCHAHSQTGPHANTVKWCSLIDCRDYRYRKAKETFTGNPFTVQKHQFFGTQFSLRSTSHTHTWLLEKPSLWLDRLVKMSAK